MKRINPIIISILFVFALLFSVLTPAFSQTEPYPYGPPNNDRQYRFVDAGSHHTVALKCNGTIMTWGENGIGQLGNNNAPTDSDVPVQVVNASGDTLSGFIAIDAGARHTLALRKDGKVFAWGRGDEGQLGDNTATSSPVPVQVNNIDSAIAIAAGDDFSMALLADSSVIGWGQNGQGQLGNNTLPNNVDEPTAAFNLDNSAVSLAAGNCHSMVLLADSTIWTAGCDDAGQLGDDGNSSDVPVPVQVNYASTGNPVQSAIGIAAGVEHSVAVIANGDVLTWGATSGGGNAVELNRSCSTPDCKMAGAAENFSGNAVAVAAGWKTTTAYLADSTLVSWGENDNGELGIGSYSATQAPTAVTTLNKKVVAIASGVAPGSGGGQHSIALLENDSIKTWGLNDAGQLGNGTTGGDSNTPVRVDDYDLGQIIAYAGTDTTVCAGDSAQLGRGIPPEDTTEFDYSWSPSTGLSDPNIPNPKASVSTSTSITISYILYKTPKGDSAATSCIIPDTVRVSFNSSAEADFASNAPICEDDSVDFVNTGSSGSGIKFEWDFGSSASPSSSTNENPSGIAYASPGLKTVSLTVTDSACSDTITKAKGINIHEEPNAGFTSNAPQCEGSDINFNNTGSTGSQWNYNWDFGAGSSPNASTQENPTGIEYSTDGTKTVTQTITDDNGHCSASSTGNISILATPDAAISSTAPACEGDSVDFANAGSNNTGNLDFEWNFGTDAAPASSTVEDPTEVTYSSDGNKQIQLVTTNSTTTCTDTAWTSITIHESPSATFTHPASVCEEGQVGFTNTGSSGGAWNHSWDLGAGADPATSSAANPSGISYTSNGVKTITHTVSDGTCSATETSTITIDQLPDVSYDHTAPECTGDSVYFNNTGATGGGFTFSWNFGNGSSPSSSSIEDPAVVYSTSGNKIIELTVIDNSTGCRASLDSTITIHQTPEASFTSTAPQCENTDVDFTHTGSTGANWNHQWDFGAGASPNTSNQQDPTGITYQSPGAKVITLTTSNDQGNCNATFIDTIGVLNTPEADFSSTAPNCTGDSVTFTNTGSSAPMLSYDWDFGSGSNPGSLNLENPQGITYNSQGTKSVKQVITNTNNGCQDSMSRSITIHLTPTVSFSSNAPQCAGTDVAFNNSGSSGQMWSYDWDFGADALPNTSSQENPSGITFAKGGDKMVMLTVASANCQNRDSAMISIDSLPTAEAGKDTTICANRCVKIGAPSQANHTYNWFPASTLDDASSAQPTACPEAAINNYHLMVTNNTTGCSNEDSVTVTMISSGLVNAGTDATICKGDTVQLGTGLIEGQDYHWTPIGSLNDPSVSNPMAWPDTTTNFKLGISHFGCDTLYDQVKVTVNPLPDAEAGPSDTLAKGEQTKLTASGGVSYQWNPATWLSNPAISNPWAAPEDDTTYKVWVTDINGCEAMDSVALTVVESEIFIPSAFTPENSGKNDVFRVRGVREAKDFDLVIFNRQGQQIFQTSDPLSGWDGRGYPAREKVPEGAYPYVVKGKDEDGESFERKGMINLIR